MHSARAIRTAHRASTCHQHSYITRAGAVAKGGMAAIGGIKKMAIANNPGTTTARYLWGSAIAQA